MSTNKHTPGPWKVSPANGTLCAWRIESESRPSSHAVAFVAQTVGDNRIEDINAHLIAAAPELLEACKDIWQALDEWATEREPTLEEIADLREQAKAAIAKAEGKL